jgi:hypothetical protein
MKGKHVVYTTVGLAAALTAGFVATNRLSKPAARPAKSITMTGTVGYEKLSGGRVVDAETTHNAVVGAGLRLLIGLIVGDSATPYDTMAYIAVGNDTTATDTSMTALQGDTITWAQVVPDSFSYTATTITWVTLFNGTIAHNATEIGVFADSGGTMLDRARISWGALDSTDTIRAWIRLNF